MIKTGMMVVRSKAKITKARADRVKMARVRRDTVQRECAMGPVEAAPAAEGHCAKRTALACPLQQEDQTRTGR